MPEAWTGELIGKMHMAKVRMKDLAEETGWTKGYITMIMNGKRNPENAEQRLNDAFESVLRKRKGD